MLIPMSKSRFVERMLSDQNRRERERKERERRAEIDLMDYTFERVNDWYRHKQRYRPGRKKKGGEA